jgi:hypothetical protein
MAALVCLGLGGFIPALAFPWQVSGGAVWHDNVTNAERPEDLIPALQSQFEWEGVLANRSLGGGHRLRVSTGARVDYWPRFEGLNAIVPNLAATWEWKPGLGLHQPVFVARATGEWAAAWESGRGGWGGAASLAARQRVGESWLLEAGHDWRRFDARAMAFDRTGREWFGRVERQLGTSWSVAGEIRRRVGDVVSYSRPPRPDLEAIGKPITYVDTFEQDVPWIAYYFRAKTRSLAFEIHRALGQATLTLRHENRHTLHAGPGYRNRLTTLRVATSF